MKLIVNADDAGIDCARNRGIFKAVDRGIVKSISVIVCQPGWADILKQIKKKEGANLSVGFHFNLTAGKPLSKNCPTLRQANGFFFNKFELWQRAFEGSIDTNDAARELKAQYFLFKKNCGVPSHVDGHNHVHLLPGVREAFAKIVPAGMLLRLPLEKVIMPSKEIPNDLRSIYANTKQLISVFNRLSLDAKKFWRGRFRYVDDFTGTQFTDTPSLAVFKRSVRNLQGNVCEFMCHLGSRAGAQSAHFSKLKERPLELKILTSAKLRDFLKQNNIDLVSFRNYYGST